ncbi:MAG: histidine phosphatase family protein [Clostridia bacterium]|nr:histidine phosphatase family protein [Clostridia bacterium]
MLLTRHGQTEWNLLKKVQGKADIELNETGM